MGCEPAFGGLSLSLYPFPSPPLEVGTLKYSLGVWGSAISSLSGVWGLGRAPADFKFGAF